MLCTPWLAAMVKSFVCCSHLHFCRLPLSNLFSRTMDFVISFWVKS
ncbi:hypothetical protein [Piscirickettsia salmonis]